MGPDRAGARLNQLDAEAAGSRQRSIFVRLRPGLLGAEGAPTYRQIGEEMGKTEGAVKMAAHRLRARYRTLIRDEIAHTVADLADVDDEIAALMAALAI